jgi:hypothetical protein
MTQSPFPVAHRAGWHNTNANQEMAQPDTPLTITMTVHLLSSPEPEASKRAVNLGDTDVQ